MRPSILPFLLLAAYTFVLHAQPGAANDPRLRYGSLIYAEAACFPSDSAGLARVDIFVRVSYDFMIFSRSNGGSPDSLFTAAAEVTGRLMQDGKTLRTRHSVARAAAGDYDATTMRDRYLLLRHTYYVPPGAYEAVVEVVDKGSTRQTLVRQDVLAVTLNESGREAGQPQEGMQRIGEPIPLAQAPDAGEHGFSVLAFGRTLPFSEPALVGIPVPAGYSAEWQVRLSSTGEKRESDTARFLTVQPITRIPGAVPEGNEDLVADFRVRPSDVAGGDVIVLALPFDGLDVGEYSLQVRASWAGGVDSTVVPMHILWRDMPFSMRDIDFAIDAMRFILTAEEYKKMKSGSDADMQRAFRRYWKGRDPTPGTEYNEMMAEYFRRVDQAYYKFQTLYLRNGIQTDRGKVYVLFGPPEDVERVMSLEDPVAEIWKYPSLGKNFRFIDKSRDGNLRLMED